jgi:hypothetical protein
MLLGARPAEAVSPAPEPTSLRAKRLNGVHASSPRRWDRRRQDCRREDEYRRSDQRKRPWKLEFGNVITSQARQPPTHEAACGNANRCNPRAVD